MENFSVGKEQVGLEVEYFDVCIFDCFRIFFVFYDCVVFGDFVEFVFVSKLSLEYDSDQRDNDVNFEFEVNVKEDYVDDSEELDDEVDFVDFLVFFVIFYLDEEFFEGSDDDRREGGFGKRFE